MKSGRGGRRTPGPGKSMGRPLADDSRGQLKSRHVRLYDDQWEYLGRFGNRSMALRLFIDNDKK